MYILPLSWVLFVSSLSHLGSAAFPFASLVTSFQWSADSRIKCFQLKHLYRMLASITRTHVNWNSDKDSAATRPLVSSTHGKKMSFKFCAFPCHQRPVSAYLSLPSLFHFCIYSPVLGLFIWVELKIRLQLAFTMVIIGGRPSTMWQVKAGHQLRLPMRVIVPFKVLPDVAGR